MVTKTHQQLYSSFEAIARSIAQKEGISISNIPTIMRRALAKIDLKDFDSKKKSVLLTDFRKSVQEEVHQIQKQD